MHTHDTSDHAVDGTISSRLYLFAICTLQGRRKHHCCRELDIISVIVFRYYLGYLSVFRFYVCGFAHVSQMNQYGVC